MNIINVKVKIESNDHRVLDKSVLELINIVKNEGLSICGPIPVVNREIKFALRRAPSIYKVSFERYKISIHKRIFFIQNVESSTKLKCLGQVVIPKNVFIKISIYNK